MKKILYLMPCLFLLSFLQDDDLIVWKQDRPLTWADFKGKPAKRFAVASTTYNILKKVKIGDEHSAQVTIETVFYCKDSWRKGAWADSTVLVHEQKHFDIAELYARKYRKLVKTGSYNDYKSLYDACDSLYNVIDKEMDVYQDLYDEETDGSTNGKEQRRWNKKVIDEINALKNYEATDFEVTFSKKH